MQNAAEEVGVGALPGPGLRFGEGLQLEATDQVVHEDAQLRPGAVGRVVLRRDHVEGELGFELGKVCSYAPRPQANAHSAGSPSGRFVVTA